MADSSTRPRRHHRADSPDSVLAIRLARTRFKVDLISLTPVKRSHSVCFARRIQIVAISNRQPSATTSGSTSTTHRRRSDFLSHQLAVQRELRSGRPRYRIDGPSRCPVQTATAKASLSRRFRWHALQDGPLRMARTKTGTANCLYALDEAGPRKESEACVRKFEFGISSSDPRRDRSLPWRRAQNMTKMEIRPSRRRGLVAMRLRLIYGTRHDDVLPAVREPIFQAGAKLRQREFIPSPPTAIPARE